MNYQKSIVPQQLYLRSGISTEITWRGGYFTWHWMCRSFHTQFCLEVSHQIYCLKWILYFVLNPCICGDIKARLKFNPVWKIFIRQKLEFFFLLFAFFWPEYYLLSGHGYRLDTILNFILCSFLIVFSGRLSFGT